MKYVFLAAFCLLLLLSGAVYLRTDAAHGGAPVLYWTTDPNPARVEQVRLFRKWLADTGHADIELRLDTANSDPSKKIIQGVSGVAGDLLDLGPTDLPFFVSTGLLADVTDAARSNGFSPADTFATVRPLIEQNGRQYRYPCNVSVQLMWANKTTLAKYGQPLPPAVWDMETFERLGRAFVAAAAKPGERQMVFYADGLDRVTLRRGLGLDTYNETLTRCTLDDARYVRVLEKLRQWTFVDRLLPNAADVEGFATGGGYAGVGPQLFNNGNYALLLMGRHALIQLRAFGPMDLVVLELPTTGFRNAVVTVRGTGVYAGSKHRREAELFLQFLASQPYNEQITADADALPPNPAFAQGEAFTDPPGRPSERGVHAPFADAAKAIGVPPSVCPFVLPGVADRIDLNAYDGFMLSGRLTAAAAAKQAAVRINAEIERNVGERPELRADYEKRLTQQKQIDALRSAGKQVPLAWIDNPFHRAYYRAQGWADEGMGR